MHKTFFNLKIQFSSFLLKSLQHATKNWKFFTSPEIHFLYIQQKALISYLENTATAIYFSHSFQCLIMTHLAMTKFNHQQMKSKLIHQLIPGLKGGLYYYPLFILNAPSYYYFCLSAWCLNWNKSLKTKHSAIQDVLRIWRHKKQVFYKSVKIPDNIMPPYKLSRIRLHGQLPPISEESWSGMS